MFQHYGLSSCALTCALLRFAGKRYYFGCGGAAGKFHEPASSDGSHMSCGERVFI